MNSFWDKSLEYLKDNLMPTSYQTFVEPLYIDHVDEKSSIIYFAWPNNEKLIQHVKTRYKDVIEDAINR